MKGLFTNLPSSVGHQSSSLDTSLCTIFIKTEINNQYF